MPACVGVTQGKVMGREGEVGAHKTSTDASGKWNLNVNCGLQNGLACGPKNAMFLLLDLTWAAFKVGTLREAEKERV